jgi:hypothetical protein
VAGVKEVEEFSLTQQIQINRPQLAHLQPQRLQMDSSFQTMVGFADSAKTTTSLVELSAIDVRNAKIMKIVKESLVTYWSLDSIKRERRTMLLQSVQPLR